MLARQCILFLALAAITSGGCKQRRPVGNSEIREIRTGDALRYSYKVLYNTDKQSSTTAISAEENCFFIVREPERAGDAPLFETIPERFLLKYYTFPNCANLQVGFGDENDLKGNFENYRAYLAKDFILEAHENPQIRQKSENFPAFFTILSKERKEGGVAIGVLERVPNYEINVAKATIKEQVAPGSAMYGITDFCPDYQKGPVMVQHPKWLSQGKPGAEGQPYIAKMEEIRCNAVVDTSSSYPFTVRVHSGADQKRLLTKLELMTLEGPERVMKISHLHYASGVLEMRAHDVSDLRYDVTFIPKEAGADKLRYRIDIASDDNSLKFIQNRAVTPIKDVFSGIYSEAMKVRNASQGKQNLIWSNAEVIFRNIDAKEFSEEFDGVTRKYKGRLEVLIIVPGQPTTRDRPGTAAAQPEAGQEPQQPYAPESSK